MGQGKSKESGGGQTYVEKRSIGRVSRELREPKRTAVPRLQKRPLKMSLMGSLLGMSESHESLMKALGNKLLLLEQFIIGLMNLNLEKPTLKMNLVQIIELVRFLLREDGRIMYQQLEKSVHIGSAAINIIINDHLKNRKLVSRWVPHILTED
ncbi:hypothetical protein LAZ67_8000384 [Cordylochernes scorpioides]|uniref:Uncharacterized protein n=1 Tax=Cordylochernes scorpioides TaxID=51811 RepID=A0ABY6KS86_9ARAC|nr:hypothetical protein LAZ67_8000384 [Cordylochernes scorpioides]